MNKLMMTVVLAAGAAFELSAMPTKAETEQAEPLVQKMLASEQAALKDGKNTRSEVAAAALKLAGETDTEAAKLLMMKGAFVLYVRDGKIEKAADTMNAIKKAIADLPPQCVTNMVDVALLGMSKKEDEARLYRLLDAAKKDVAKTQPLAKDRTTIQSIIDGMIKVPGRDYWMSETELTQGQWVSVMGYNLSKHKGANLPVENVSRDDCDVFLEKLNQTKEVRASQFEFCLPTRAGWAHAARAGSGNETKLIPFVKPGVVGDLLDMAWLKENSAGQTHAVATKVPNAWGFYDMVGNVSEQVIERPGQGCERGYSFTSESSSCRPGLFHSISRDRREPCYGLRVAAHIRSDRVKWTYEVVDGEIVLGGNGRMAVPKTTTGALEIPAVIDGKPVRGIGSNAFRGCYKLTSVTIPSSVKSIDAWAFTDCCGLKSVTIPEGVTSVGWRSFEHCHALPSVMIPASVTNLSPVAFMDCALLSSVGVHKENPVYKSVDGMVLTKDGGMVVVGRNGDVTIPAGVTNIGFHAFCAWGGLKSVTIPSGVKIIDVSAFRYCSGLTSVTIPASVTYIGDAAFWRCYGLSSVTMLGERPEVFKREPLFGHCGKLKAIHVPANAKSWKGMKEWQGIPLVFD